MLLSQPFLPVLLLSLLISVHVNSTRGRFSSSSRKSKNDMKVEEDLQFFSSVTRGRSGGDTSVEEDFSLYAINHDQILTLPSIINLVKTEIDQFPSAKTIATNWLNTWKSKLIFTPSRGIAGIDQIDLQFLPESGDPAKEYDNCLLSTYNFKTHTSHISDLMTQKMSGSSRFYSCPSGHTLVQLHDSISKILGMEQSTLVDAAAFTFSRNPGFPLSNNFWIMVPLVKALLVPMSTPRLVFTDVSYYAKDGYKFSKSNFE